MQAVCQSGVNYLFQNPCVANNEELTWCDKTSIVAFHFLTACVPLLIFALASFCCACQADREDIEEPAIFAPNREVLPGPAQIANARVLQILDELKESDDQEIKDAASAVADVRADLELRQHELDLRVETNLNVPYDRERGYSIAIAAAFVLSYSAFLQLIEEAVQRDLPNGRRDQLTRNFAVTRDIIGQDLAQKERFLSKLASLRYVLDADERRDQ